MEGAVKNACCYECEWYWPSDYDRMHGMCAYDAERRDFEDWKSGKRKSLPEAIPVPAYGWSACGGDFFTAR